MNIRDIIKKIEVEETKLEGLAELKDYEEAINRDIEDYKKKLSDAEEKITTLRDTNQRLYLRVSATEEEPEEEKNAYEILMERKGVKD